MFYIVGTPLGNSDDMSIRAARTLSSVDIILVEDTRSFHSFYKKACERFELVPKKDQKIISYHDQNEFQQAPYVLKMLERRKDIALASESGMPLVSDPGSLLLREIIKAEYEYTCVPGATAFVTASVLSGFDASKLLFLGFLPKKESEKVKLFKKIKDVNDILTQVTVAFYESPHRINQTLELLAIQLPDCKVAVCRELTKKFEEVVKGSPADLSKNTFKGEATIVLSF